MSDRKRKPRLTDTDWKLLRRALNDAMDERDSYADAWAQGTPERAEALEYVRRYEALHRKLFGDDSLRQKDMDRFAAMPTVPISELMAGKKGILP